MTVIARAACRRLPLVSGSALRRRLLGTSILAGMAMMAVDTASAATTLDELVFFSGGSRSIAYAVTDSGIVVGEAESAGVSRNPTSWVGGGAPVNLGTLGGTLGNARAISADGTVIVGYADLPGDLQYHAYLLSTTTSITTDLGTLGGSGSFAFGVSADGAVVAGNSNMAGDHSGHAFRWTLADGIEDLGTLGGTNSTASAISGNGLVIVGQSQPTGDAENFAYRLVQGGSMVSLGALGGTNSAANGTSYDGSVVVGYASTTGNAETHAFRWTSADGMVDISAPSGDIDSRAYGVSADGSIVVGYSIDASYNNYAFYWTQAGGLENLNTILSDSGVDMTDISLYQANGISPNGKYIVGEGFFPGHIPEAFLVYYDGATSGVTTASQQQEAAQTLSTNQQTLLVESRSTVGQLLGFSRPVDARSYTYAGGLFGSAVGYTGGQFSGNGVTLLGGIGYGAQDYKNIEQDNAITLALAGRYTLSDTFAGQSNLSPFIELGGWMTPHADLTLHRPYGTGTSVGVGTTASALYADYARAGLAWEMNDGNKLTGYGEIGQQFMKFDGYSEIADAANPFPASVDGGVARMDIARLGGAWTHKVEGLDAPVSLTLAGAAAHAFSGQSGLTTNVSGLGTSTATFKTVTWAEFGADVETQVTDSLAINLNISGTTGGHDMGTVLHGGVGATFKF